MPYALWWLVIIETVALASEEAHEPQVSIPRGLVLAQITLVVLVLLTWFFASAAAPFAETGAVDYPLPLVFKKVWGSGWFLTAFSAVAVAGMVVSYNGMIYATSRQSFSLGRAGYLPKALGRVHPTRRTPHISLAVWTAVTISFIVFGHFYEKATAIAILISTLTAVIWYVLAMLCLIVLRRKEPALLRLYRVPMYPAMPIFVAVLSAIAGFLYVWSNVQVILPTAVLYAAAGIWYATLGTKKGAGRGAGRGGGAYCGRTGTQTERDSGSGDGFRRYLPAASSVSATGPILMPADPLYTRQLRTVLGRVTWPFLGPEYCPFSG